MDTAEVGTPTAPLFRLTCLLAGVDPGLIAACPPRDRDGVRLLCGLMALVWVWQSGVFAAVAHLMLAPAGEIRGDLIAAAMLLATIILLLDATVVMRPSWTSLGHEELRRGGLAIRLPALARIEGGVFLALRLALSVVVGTLVALFVSLVLYGKDIAGQFAAGHAARNAPVIAAATRVVDDRLARNIGAQAELRARFWPGIGRRHLGPQQIGIDIRRSSAGPAMRATTRTPAGPGSELVPRPHDELIALQARQS